MTPIPPDAPKKVSPTGKPKIPPSLTPYFFMGFTLCGSVTTVAATMKLPEWLLIAAAIGTLFFTGMGMLGSGWRGKAPVVLLFLALGLSSCAHQSPLLITGEVLDGAALAFEATAAGMASANAQHQLTDAQRDGWNAFLPRFKASFHLACKLWRAAKDSSDSKLEEQAAEIARTLIAELATFSAVLMKPPASASSPFFRGPPLELWASTGGDL